jgi:hypothetical protein
MRLSSEPKRPHSGLAASPIDADVLGVQEQVLRRQQVRIARPTRSRAIEVARLGDGVHAGEKMLEDAGLTCPARQ